MTIYKHINKIMKVVLTFHLGKDVSDFGHGSSRPSLWQFEQIQTSQAPAKILAGFGALSVAAE